MLTTPEPTYEELQKEVARLNEELSSCRQAESAYRLMLASSTDSLYMVDRDCRYLFINSRHLLSRLNLSFEDVLGKNYGEFHSPEQTEEFSQLVNQVINTGTSLQHEHESQHDGRYFLRTLSPIRETNHPDHISAVLVTSKDITSIKLAQASLQESKAMYRDLINAMRSMVFLKDDQARYLLVNNAFLNWLDKKEEDVLGKTDLELLPAEVALKLREAEQKTLQDGFYNETFNDLIKGSVYEFKIFIINLVNHKIGTGGLLSDITDQVNAEMEKDRLEAQFLQAQKMEAIGTLAGGIAHNFNNLLMGIKGAISLMLFNISENHPYYERLRSVELQVESGADLTKQLLGFARGGKYEIKTTDLNDIIHKSATVFGQTKKEIIITEKYAPGLWKVEVDQGQFEQVMFNLYINAWQAMPEGGNLNLETANCELDDDYCRQYFIKSGRYVKITVADTGLGMDSQVCARVFEPFFTTKEMGRGTGLGLATVYGIIKSHGGFISVISELEKGSLFTIYLPASHRDTVEEVTKIPDLSPGMETILLIDDENMVIEVTKELLEMLGYKVIMATSGSDALNIYREKAKEISLVVLDMIMPGMSGGETFDALKRINPAVKVILSSGYSLNSKVSDILERGCLAFLQKPFSTHELSGTIRKALAEG